MDKLMNKCNIPILIAPEMSWYASQEGGVVMRKRLVTEGCGGLFWVQRVALGVPIYDHVAKGWL